MKQNRAVEGLRDMWLKRLKALAQPNHRSTVAITSAGVAVVLIIGGLAFAGQSGSGPETIRQAASLFSSGPSDSSSSKSDSSTSSSSSQSSKSKNPFSSKPATPTTIIGPHGETIVVPPPSTKPNGSPAPTSPSRPLDTVLPPPVTPLSVTTAPPARPVDANGPSVPTADVTVKENSPEDPTVLLQVTGSDSDGYVSSITIDWNDGSVPQVFTNPKACQLPLGSSQSISPSYTYANSGSYNITVTVTSTNCAGDTSNTQQAINPQTVDTGGTNTPPVTTGGGGGGAGSPGSGS